MSMTLAELEAEALKLSPDGRVRLADVPYTSLDGVEPLDEAWEAEFARRVAEIESGEVECITAEQVYAELRAELAALRARS